MEQFGILLNKFSAEVPHTTVGAVALVILYYTANVTILNFNVFIELSWIERILVLGIFSFVAGKIFCYIGSFLVSIIAHIRFLPSIKKTWNYMKSSMLVLDPASKTVSIFPKERILETKIFEHIGKDQYLQNQLFERNSSVSFTHSLLGLVVALPYFADSSLYKSFWFWMIVLFFAFLATSSLIKRETFLGHCAKECDQATKH